MGFVAPASCRRFFELFNAAQQRRRDAGATKDYPVRLADWSARHRDSNWHRTCLAPPAG
jgi:hypothetical protein